MNFVSRFKGSADVYSLSSCVSFLYHLPLSLRPHVDYIYIYIYISLNREDITSEYRIHTHSSMTLKHIFNVFK
jgi:hypothetical protein